MGLIFGEEFKIQPWVIPIYFAIIAGIGYGIIHFVVKYW